MPVRLTACLLLLSASSLTAQAPDLGPAAKGLTLRNIGPAVMGGRISDIAVSHADPRTWYVSAGSGGVWKTTNAGVTWTPVFDDQPSYSIGEITIDPRNPDLVWVGTGENVSGRHVGWGDGVYRSRDGGRTWQRMGLPNSQHIGRILVDPRDSDVILVAAEGPLWSPGGDRGVYRSADGGATWTPVLQVNEHTGATDLEFDPSNPDVVYAALYQRRRHVWGFMAGGPSSGVWKSADNGATWRQVTTGLPAGDKGKIGLAVTPADPSLVYATIEAGEGDRGFYRSRNQGESWEKRNSYISGGTGPHYYQELEASPRNPDLVYQMDVFINVTRDGGATFGILETAHDKHSDNHAMWIDPADDRHLLVGTDAGLYESFDQGRTFRHFPNLPISQFYKVAVNSRLPYYDVLVGAQDLGTLHGPSRTLNRDGIRNQDWYVPLGADGYGVAFHPQDPDVMYLMWQQGELNRVNSPRNEEFGIKPVPAVGDPPERWNWDSPLLVSPHRPDRIYYGSQRIWRSDDRGNSWTAISGDLTQGANRYELPFMGRVWSVDALHDNGAMSKYATTTAITESPVTEGVLTVGTDDGLVQVSEDGGATWRRATALPGLPARSFVNDVEASRFDAATVFVAADNHKMGDFAPYLFASSDLGRIWRSIAGDLPAGSIVWAIQQDHVRPELLFAASESGIYWTPNGGTNWHRVAGSPTIPFRDLQLQRRDNDVVGATFGRGVWILDDYTPLREMAAGGLAGEGALFPIRDAWWYVPSTPGQAPGRPTWGSDDWTGPNPPMGALFTYWLREVPKTPREARQAEEKAVRERAADLPFPGFDRLREETVQSGPRVLLVVRDAAGRPVRTVEGPATAGLHRVNWDIRGPSPDPVDLSPPGFSPPWNSTPPGPLTPPGRYTAELMLVADGSARRIGEPRQFEVKPVPGLRSDVDYVAVASFQQETAELMRRISGVGAELGRADDRLRHMRAALARAPRADQALYGRLDRLTRSLAALGWRLNGDPARGRLNEASAPSVRGRVGSVIGGHWGTTEPPTATQREQIRIAAAEFEALASEVRTLLEEELVRLETDLEAAGAPWTPGRRVP